MIDDWVTIYVIIVLSISAIPLLLLFCWSIALCLEEMKEIRIHRRDVYMENVRGIISGTTGLASGINSELRRDTICISGTTGLAELANATAKSHIKDDFSSEVV